MRFAVRHSTTYTYSDAVRLEPHVLRLRPRGNGGLRLLQFALQIDPPPIRFSECIDLEGNCVGHAWFDGLTDRLSIESSFEIETQRVNAFDYLLEPDAQTLPLRYPKDLGSRIAPYCSRGSDNYDVAEFARCVADLAHGRTLDFLQVLATAVAGAAMIQPTPWPFQIHTLLLQPVENRLAQPQLRALSLAQTFLAVIGDTDSTNSKRQAALEQLRRLNKLLPDSLELREQLTEARKNVR